MRVTMGTVRKNIINEIKVFPRNNDICVVYVNNEIKKNVFLKSYNSFNIYNIL